MTASAADYYVSPEGAGNKDGSNWENAWDLETFKTEFSENGSKEKKFQGADVYFAEGYYGGAFTLYVRWGLNLHGTTNGGRTVFTGDTDNDGVADRDRLFKILTNNATDRPVTIENIDFENFKLNQVKDLNSDNSNGVGVFWLFNCISTVNFNNCNFKDITNEGHGGSAIFAKTSNIVLNKCTFKNISALARGVVIRLTSGANNKGTTTLNNCVFEACKATTTTATEPCGLVMLQHGEKLTVVNSVFKNNIDSKGNGGALWIGKSETSYKRELIVDNCLMYNNSADTAPAIFFNDQSMAVTYNNCKMDDKSAVVMPSINISSVGTSTYYVGAPFTMPAGVTGKTISAADNGALTYGETYNAGDDVPAGTALLVSGAEGKYEPVLATVETSAPENLLKGSDVAATTEGGDKYYKLANDSEKGLGFYWGAAEGAAFQNGAHKAYLALSYTQAAKARFFSLDGETTGINNIATGVARQGKYVENGTIVIVRNGIKYNVQGIKL